MELPPGSDRRLRLVKIASKQETKTMSTMMIYIIIIAVSLLLIIGFLASANEFKKMDKHPEDYRHRWPLMEGSPEEQRRKHYNQ